MGLRNLGGALLLAYLCSSSLREPESAKPRQTYLYPLINKEWSVFGNDYQISESIKSNVSQRSDSIWNIAKRLYPQIHAEKPIITFKHEAPEKKYLQLGYWRGDTISIMIGKKDSTHLLKDLYAEQKMSYSDFVSNLDKVMIHEMGHHLFAKFSQKNGTGNIWWEPQDSMNYYQIVAYNLVSEGIPEYYRKRITKNQLEPINLKMYEIFPVYVQAIDVYAGGYSLVKPILDKYGVEGIDFLSKHPPGVHELNNLVKYQKNCMNALEEKKILEK